MEQTYLYNQCLAAPESDPTVHSAMLASDPTPLSAATHAANLDAQLWLDAFNSEIASLKSKQGQTYMRKESEPLSTDWRVDSCIC